MDEEMAGRNERADAAASRSHVEPVPDRGVQQAGQEAPVVRVGDTFESMDQRDDDASGGRRRVRVLEVGGGRALVENVSTRRLGWVSVERLCPPRWRFVA